MSALFEDPMLTSDHGLRCRGAQTNDQLRAHACQLGPEPRLARGDFRGRRPLVNAPLAALFEFEMLDRIGNVDLGASDAGFG